jgi:hypothetical protein
MDDYRVDGDDLVWPVLNCNVCRLCIDSMMIVVIYATYLIVPVVVLYWVL